MEGNIDCDDMNTVHLIIICDVLKRNASSYGRKY